MKYKILFLSFIFSKCSDNPKAFNDTNLEKPTKKEKPLNSNEIKDLNALIITMEKYENEEFKKAVINASEGQLGYAIIFIMNNFYSDNYENIGSKFEILLREKDRIDLNYPLIIRFFEGDKTSSLLEEIMKRIDRIKENYRKNLIDMIISKLKEKNKIKKDVLNRSFYYFLCPINGEVININLLEAFLENNDLDFNYSYMGKSLLQKVNEYIELLNSSEDFKEEKSKIIKKTVKF